MIVLALGVPLLAPARYEPTLGRYVTCDWCADWLFLSDHRVEAGKRQRGATRAKRVITDAEIGASLRFTSVEVARDTRERPASPA